jgi:hypothetical protein
MCVEEWRSGGVEECVWKSGGVEECVEECGGVEECESVRVVGSHHEK